jgi:hypothetical protein
MKKYIIAVFIAITLGLSFFFLYLNTSTQKWERCYTHEVTKYTLKDGMKVELNVDIDVVNDDDNQSEIFLFGTFKHSNESYTITRRILLTKQEGPIKNTSTIAITKESLYPRDNVPADLWNKYALPITRDLPIYIKSLKLKRNSLIIKALDNPIFVCTIQD